MESENNIGSVKRGTGNHVILLVFALFFLGAVSVTLAVVWFRDRVSENLADFSALWNTTDALQRHIVTKKKWPGNWDELRPSLAYVDPGYRGGDFSIAETRVEINFRVDTNSAAHGRDWYVRLKSGRMVPEQDAANRRLYDLITHLAQRGGVPEQR